MTDQAGVKSEQARFVLGQDMTAPEGRKIDREIQPFAALVNQFVHGHIPRYGRNGTRPLEAIRMHCRRQSHGPAPRIPLDPLHLDPRN